MEHRSRHRPRTRRRRLLERLEDELGPHVVLHREPQHPRRSLVANGAEVGLAFADAQIGDVRGPQLVDPVWMELAVHQVRRVDGGWIGAGGDLEQSRTHPDDPEAGHALGHGVGLTRSPASWRSAVIRGRLGAVRALVEVDDLGVEVGARRTWLGSAGRSWAALQR